MDELGAVLEGALKWARRAAILGMVVLAFLVYNRWDPPAQKAVAATDEPQQSNAEQKKAADVIDETPEEAQDRERQQQAAANEQAAEVAAAAAAARTASPDPQEGSQPEPSLQTAPVVYMGYDCGAPPPNDYPVHPKHHWPRRFFGAIGHGLKAIGRGIGKAGKTVVRR